MIQIKNIISSTFILLVVASCGTPLSIPEAEKTATNYIELLNEQKYEQALEISSGDYSSENLKNSSVDKMKILHEKLGPSLSFELSDSIISEEFAQTTNIQLTYKVKHKNVNTEEVFIVVKELGECKIYKHVITNQW